MRPLLALLLCLVAGLVRADSPQRSVEFEVCYLDIHAIPPVFRRHPRGRKFIIRADQIGAISNPDIDAEGIECVRIGASGNYTIFVVGTFESIKAKLGWD